MDSKEKKMTKNYKAVLKSSLVMLVLFAVAGSGVAQAQSCEARAKSSEIVRAEGLTEVVGQIELQCRRPAGATGSFFDATIPAMLDITVQLNTNITNEVSDARVVKAADGDVAPGYQDGGIVLNADELGGSGESFTVTTTEVLAANFTDGELSDDGNAIEWTEIPTSGLNLTPDNTGQRGFNVIISGIRANASMVGDGEDIMANVMVGDTVVNSAPLKVADVTEGLMVKVDPVAAGLQCADTNDAMATITIQEGFVDAIVSMVDEDSTTEVNESANSDSLVVTFTGIPDGVMVMVPAMVAVGMIENPDNPNEMIHDPAAIGLTLREGTRTDGVGDIDAETGLGAVELNTAGAGEVIYNIASYEVAGQDTASTDNTVNEEWVNLEVTFAWKSGGDMPVAIGGGYVDVSFHPVSSAGGVSFDDSKMPRFVVSNDPVMVVEIDDCITTLLFPFVTNKGGFDTGIAITNTSADAGPCTITYYGADAPDEWETDDVAAERQTAFVVSATALNFQGYITANCGFRGGHGFAFITNNYGIGGPTLAQSYLAICTDCDKD